MQRGGAARARAPARVEDLVAQTFGVETILPTQFACRRKPTATGARALLVRLLMLALLDAGWTLDGRTCALRVVPRTRQRWQGSQALARGWLLGELDDQVAVPVAWVCDALGIDATALAAVVRARLPSRTHGVASSLSSANRGPCVAASRADTDSGSLLTEEAL